MNLIEQARLLSVEAHAGQFRKWHPSVAYVAHLDRVRERVMSLGYPVPLGVAAQLHDIFEDCHRVYRDRVAQMFGPAIYVIIHELTNPSKGLHAPRAARKAIDREYLRHVSREAATIKMVDRTDNLQDSLVADADFKRLYGAESEELLAALNSSFEFSSGDDGERQLYKDYCFALAEVKQSII